MCQSLKKKQSFLVRKVREKKTKRFATCQVTMFLPHFKTRSSPSSASPFQTFPSNFPGPFLSPLLDQATGGAGLTCHPVVTRTARALKSSPGGGPPPPLAGTSSPGERKPDLPSPSCTFPQECSLVHRAAKRAQVRKAETTRRSDKSQAQCHVTQLSWHQTETMT